MSSAEAAHIEAGRGVSGSAASVRSVVGALIRDPRFLLVMAFHAAQLSVYWGIFTWFPKYLADERGFVLRDSGFFLALPYAATGLTLLALTFYSLRSLRPGLVCAAGIVGASLVVLAAALAPTGTMAALLMALALSLWVLGGPTLYALLQRMAPFGAVGTVTGISNGTANLVGALVPGVMGYLIAGTGGYFAGFLLLVGVGTLGGVAMIMLDRKL